MKLKEEKLFPGQQKDETVELCTIRHWVTILPHALIYLGLIILLIVFDIIFIFYNPKILTPLILLIINVVAFPILFHLLFIKLFNYFLNAIIVTNYRIIDLHCTTILYRERKAIDFINIQDIEVSQKGIFERIFNYGHITLHNAAGEEVFIFSHIPKAHKNYNHMNHIYRRAIENRKSFEVLDTNPSEFS